MRKPFIIGITGSVGKTTTLEMVSAVLTHPNVTPIVGLVGQTKDGMNDDYGLPFTLLGYEKWSPLRDKALAVPFVAMHLASGLGRYPKILVLEFATHWMGHLERLAKLAPPDIGVVTTIAPAHLERLKTIQGVVREKSAIVRAVPPSGLVILGQDHDHVSELEQASRAPVVKVAGRGIELAKNITYVISQRLGVPREIVDMAMADFRSPKGRLNRLELSELTVIDDTINANPSSMKLALDTLNEVAGRRRLAILGYMAELGENAPSYHREIGAYARSRVDMLIGIGELARHYNPDQWFDTSDTCATTIAELIRPGDVILVKGSRSVRMERVVERLRAR
jgi:UDP-N-acetylmuramoyl-tripeptide--D-alanyl-D-alanine ligase